MKRRRGEPAARRSCQRVMSNASLRVLATNSDKSITTTGWLHGTGHGGWVVLSAPLPLGALRARLVRLWVNLAWVTVRLVMDI